MIPRLAGDGGSAPGCGRAGLVMIPRLAGDRGRAQLGEEKLRTYPKKEKG